MKRSFWSGMLAAYVLASSRVRKRLVVWLNSRIIEYLVWCFFSYLLPTKHLQSCELKLGSLFTIPMPLEESPAPVRRNWCPWRIRHRSRSSWCIWRIKIGTRPSRSTPFSCMHLHFQIRVRLALNIFYPCPRSDEGEWHLRCEEIEKLSQPASQTNTSLIVQ